MALAAISQILDTSWVLLPFFCVILALYGIGRPTWDRHRVLWSISMEVSTLPPCNTLLVRHKPRPWYTVERCFQSHPRVFRLRSFGSHGDFIPILVWLGSGCNVALLEA